MAKTILSCAVTGNLTTVQQNPALPCTPQQIADSSIEAAKAGAAIVHLHVRTPEGVPSMELALYRETVDRIRSSGTDVIINLTTGPGGRFVPSEADPKVAGPGTGLTTPERRVEHIIALKPEICTLDLNTMWSGSAVVINTPRNVRVMAAAMREAGSLPELEVFDSGDIALAKALIADGTLASPALFQVVMGVSYGFQSSAETLMYAKTQLPADARWAAFGIGRMAFPMLAQSYVLGGHVRIGMEDTVYLRKGVLTPGNGPLVEKAARIVDELGGELATVAEARMLLGLRAP